jgi:sulfatase maturation enzyme AslB (radical SAM superfamily)
MARLKSIMPVEDSQMAVRPSNKAVERGLNLLKDGGIRFGAIAVITRQNVGSSGAVYDFFRSAGIREFVLEPCLDRDSVTGDVSEQSVTLMEYAELLVEVFERWMLEDDPRVRITPLHDMLVTLLRGSPSLCVFRRSCFRHFTVIADGEIIPCDRLDSLIVKIGNVNLDNADQVRGKAAFLDFADRISQNSLRVQNLWVLLSLQGRLLVSRWCAHGRQSPSS